MDRHRAIVAPKFSEGARGVRASTSAARASRAGRSRKGGYFITLDVLDGCAKQVVKLAKEAGVELTPAGCDASARQ